MASHRGVVKAVEEKRTPGSRGGPGSRNLARKDDKVCSLREYESYGKQGRFADSSVARRGLPD